VKQVPPHGEDAPAKTPDLPTSGRLPEVLSLDGRLTLEDEFLSEVDEDSQQHHIAPPPHEPVDVAPEPPSVEPHVPVPPLREVMVFPAPAPEPPPPETLSIAELLDNDTPVEWAEAVAIAERICEAITRHPSLGAQEYVLDPRHIAITERGDVRVLPGAPGGDPLVKQVGRILRALLERSAAPVSLRLVVSQAALELPGFATVGDLADALRSFRKSPQSEAIQTAFRRGRDTRPPLPPPPSASPVPVISRAVPMAPAFARHAPRFSIRHHMPAVVLLLMVAGLVYLTVRGLAPSDSLPLNASDTRALVAETQPRAARVIDGPSRTVPPNAPLGPSRAPGTSVPLPQRESVRGGRSSTRTATATPIDSPDAQSQVPAPGLARADDAQRLYDRIVLADPLYTLSPERSTPEAVAALRDSKRLLVPSIARRDYERALAAFEAGAYDRAAADATRVSRMLEALEAADVPPGLSEGTRQLLARIEVARAREDQRIYSEADVGVTAPEALGRQFPAAPPIGMSQGQIGTLEMLISRVGQVEVIKLHTPLNRYHERMIVSAAKAWRFKPALKDGKPVRYRLISSINLPES
jgi:hypothetical protein